MTLDLMLCISADYTCLRRIYEAVARRAIRRKTKLNAKYDIISINIW